MYAVRGVVSGSITIGMGEHVLTDPLCALPESLDELKRRAPNVHPEIMVMTHAQLNQALRERRGQIGVRGQYKNDRVINYQPLFVRNQQLYVSDMCAKNKAKNLQPVHHNRKYDVKGK